MAKDGQVKGVTVGSGVGASDGATVSLGDEAAAMIDGVAAGPCAATVPTATQAADASITQRAA